MLWWGWSFFWGGSNSWQISGNIQITLPSCPRLIITFTSQNCGEHMRWNYVYEINFQISKNLENVVNLYIDQDKRGMYKYSKDYVGMTSTLCLFVLLFKFLLKSCKVNKTFGVLFFKRFIILFILRALESFVNDGRNTSFIKQALICSQLNSKRSGIGSWNLIKRSPSKLIC